MTDSNCHDSPVLPDLLDTAAKRFTTKRVSADKGYLAQSNVVAIVSNGTEPFIPPKANTAFRRPVDARRKKVAVWDKMLHYYLFRRDDFLRHYHRRSSVEATFHMIKSKFGTSVRSKMPIAQTNEVLCKVLCHNLCVLVQSAYEVGQGCVLEGVVNIALVAPLQDP